MFIVFHDSSSNEMIVTTKAKRKQAIEEFFAEGCGRDLTDYTEHEIDDTGVAISSKLSF